MARVVGILVGLLIVLAGGVAGVVPRRTSQWTAAKLSTILETANSALTAAGSA